jgi:peptide deformylase
VSETAENLRIVKYPDPALRAKTRPVDPADPEVHAVARRMLELMHEADGVGLAAPQVGLAWRLFVTNARDHDPIDRVFINPEISLSKEPLEIMEEGCLSLPGIYGDVRRPPSASITATGLDGERFTLELEGFHARVCQHEFDHLMGVLIIDKMSQLARLGIRKQLKELEAAAR